MRVATALLVAGLVLAGGFGASASGSGEPGGFSRSPAELVMGSGGKTLYATLPGSMAVGEVDLATGELTRVIPCPGRPNGLCLIDEGRSLAVACGSSGGVVAIIELGSGRVARTIGVGHTPRAPVVTQDGKRLFVCNQFDNDLSMVDLETGKEAGRLAMVREPFDAALSGDGSTLMVSNLLPADGAIGEHVAAVISVVDTGSLEVKQVKLLNGSTAVRGTCVTPDGKLGLAVHVLSRFNMPTTQVERGWMNTNAMSLIDLERAEVLGTVLLDEIDRGAANPWGVAVSADGSRIWVSHHGTHEVSVIETGPLLAKLESRRQELAAGGSPAPLNAANDLAFLVGVRTRISLNREGPADEAIPVEGRLCGPLDVFVAETGVAYVSLQFNPVVVSVELSTEGRAVIRRMDLGALESLSAEARGERIFDDASYCLQSWQSCATCHPDARVDGLNWDLLNDSMGNPKNTKSMLLAHQTPPSMFLGVRSTASEAVRAGFHHILFAEVSEADALDVDAYLKSLEPVASPWLEEGRLSAGARRGEALFESNRLRCSSCHPGASLFTDLKRHDVGSQSNRDGDGRFDTPTLVEIWRTAPYLHDGRYASLRELFREGLHGESEGSVSGLSDQELEDLIAYLRSL